MNKLRGLKYGACFKRTIRVFFSSYGEEWQTWYDHESIKANNKEEVLHAIWLILANKAHFNNNNTKYFNTCWVLNNEDNTQAWYM